MDISCQSYKIHLGISYLDLNQLRDQNQELFIITDSNIYHYYKEWINSSNCPCYIIQSGEIHKSRETKAEIEDFLFQKNCTKNSTLIALGGGVVGDIVGFLASTYMRGIDFIQIPTSLLAMVDSSVGGKTAVDTPFAKNSIGRIYRPRAVYIDIAFLNTLPHEMWAAGFSEIIKMSILKDHDLYSLLKSATINSLKNDSQLLLKVISTSIQHKVDIVIQDELDKSLRQVLNFGHTIGHAIEAELDGFWNHGFCVSVGIIKEIEAAFMMGKTEIEIDEIKEILKQYELPIEIPKMNTDKLLMKMNLDKKKLGKEIPILVPTEIGKIPTEALKCDAKLIKCILEDDIRPKGIPDFSASLEVSGSKSITNRVLLISSLAEGTTIIKNSLEADDTKVMMKSLQTLGIGDHIKTADGWIITGKIPKNNPQEKEIYIGNAGTAARFLTAVCLLLENDTVIKGSSRMNERPISDLSEALNNAENRVEFIENQNHFPIRVKGGGFNGGIIELKSKISSQFVSAILIAAPLFRSETTLILTNLDENEEPVSASYIEMTIKVMNIFGAQVEKISNREYKIYPTGYKSPGEFIVEPDACSLSYFIALSVLHKKPITISRINLNSVQGELEFLNVIEAMGATIRCYNNSIVVTPNDLKPVTVNMNRCTDSFITAAIIMACTEGVSIITGIANQRVKECNRIKAVIAGLQKVGVYSEELEDGIKIYGNSADLLFGNYEIETYDDHRIAMAFGVLSTVIKGGIVIKRKNVVNKTFPEFWKILRECGIEYKSTQKKRKKPKSLVLIGMRGIGKSSIAWKYAEETGWEFLDIDTIIANDLKVESLRDWIYNHGILAFRELEFATLSKIIRKERVIISTGGGIIENPKSLTLLKAFYPVIWMKSSISNIAENIENDENLNRISGDIEETYAFRKPLYKQVHDFKFYYFFRDIDEVFGSFLTFTKRILEEKAPLPNDFSYFGCISSFSNGKLSEYIRNNSNIAGYEIRIDCLSSLKEALQLLSCIREISDSLQIILTLRTAQQGGKYNGNDYWKILHKIISWSPDFIDVEFAPTIDWKHNYNEFLQKCISPRIILSYHSHNTENLKEIHYMMTQTKPDILKFISPSFEKLPSPGFQRTIHFTMGKENIITRVQNASTNYVSLSEKLAEGQLTFEEIQNFQFSLNISPSLFKFYVIGNDVKKSPSPFLFNSIFEEKKIPYNYSVMETQALEPIIHMIKSRECLGGSVTIPFKEEIMQYLDFLTDDAKELGAVNTLMKHNGKLIGDNTDWLGIYCPIVELGRKFEKAVILGAGGTCKAALYALRKLKVREIWIWNRSEARLQGINWPNKTTNLNLASGAELIISTLPGIAEVDLPWLNPATVILEAAYFPPETYISRQATIAGSLRISALTMFVYQAYYQYQYFTGRNVALSKIKKYTKL
ncbi:unnamed protein product [Blepharisma stoltei]|uniref:3-phosphoshikimate 1-carboxyvinyltransferase n=1 Tax=Blepharisma stoltei TaxID=1481888 RepID=A0AAU9IIM5_9CILI|nr:unnamed protein product [Blepharisma stoltei]